MTQKETILRMLKEHPEGISSGAIYAQHIGRPGARIEDLVKDGHPVKAIGRDPRDPKYVIYALVGSSAGPVGLEGGSSPTAQMPGVAEAPRHSRTAGASAASSERSTPSMFDPDDHLDWGSAA